MLVTCKLYNDRLTIRIKPNGDDAIFKRMPRMFLAALINRKLVGEPTKFADLVTTFLLRAGDRHNGGLDLFKLALVQVRLFEQQHGEDTPLQAAE